MKKKLVVLLACACFAALLSAGCADKSTKVSSTPGEAPAGQAATSAPAQQPAASGGDQQAAPAARPVEETSSAQPQSATASSAQQGGSSAAPAQPKEQVVTPAAPMTAKTELLQRIHFEYDKSAITPESKALLDKNFDYLSKNAGVKVQIVGHCDERGTNEYNMALGDRRANSAKSYLANRGIAANRLDTLSKGEEEPVDAGHDETAWAKNRRAEFLTR